MNGADLACHLVVPLGSMTVMLGVGRVMATSG
nr:MAG TPA: hypothetical protein [Caudoviricetes sp.]